MQKNLDKTQTGKVLQVRMILLATDFLFCNLTSIMQPLSFLPTRKK